MCLLQHSESEEEAATFHIPDWSSIMPIFTSFPKNMTTQNKMVTLAHSQLHWRRVLMIKIYYFSFQIIIWATVDILIVNVNNVALTKAVDTFAVSTLGGKGKRVEFICSDCSFLMLARCLS